MNRNDSPWANAANALALLRPDKFAPKPDNDAPQSTPSCQQAVNKERETEKGKSPHTPLKEKDKGKEIPPSPSPSITHARTHARTHAQGKPDWTGAGAVGIRQGFGTGAGAVGIRQGFGTGTGAGTEHRPTSRIIDHDFIHDESRDPVAIALTALDIPQITVVNGKTYNNPRLFRWMVRQIGEAAFRDILYQQWDENRTDGEPESRAATFMAKLYARRDAMRGGVA